MSVLRPNFLFCLPIAQSDDRTQKGPTLALDPHMAFGEDTIIVCGIYVDWIQFGLINELNNLKSRPIFQLKITVS